MTSVGRYQRRRAVALLTNARGWNKPDEVLGKEEKMIMGERINHETGTRKW
jgi:hypothetical protein